MDWTSRELDQLCSVRSYHLPASNIAPPPLRHLTQASRPVPSRNTHVPVDPASRPWGGGESSSDL